MNRATDRSVILILLIGEASGVFAGFCPSWFTVASPFFHEQEAKAGNVKRIRWGEIAATLIVLATGAAVAKQQNDKFPIGASLLISAIFIGGYEYQIAHPSTDDAAGTAGAPSGDDDDATHTTPIGASVLLATPTGAVAPVVPIGYKV